MELAAMLAALISGGTKMAQNMMAPKEFEPEAAPQQQAQGGGGSDEGYNTILKKLVEKLFGTPAPTNINPPATSQMVGPFKPTSMPQDDPYGFGNYY